MTAEQEQQQMIYGLEERIDSLEDIIDKLRERIRVLEACEGIVNNERRT